MFIYIYLKKNVGGGWTPKAPLDTASSVLVVY